MSDVSSLPSLRQIIMFREIFILGFIGLVAFFFHSILHYKTPEGIVYEMPIECQRDLSEATQDTEIYHQPASTLAAWNRFLKIAPEGYRLFGVTVNFPGFDRFIVIDESLDQETYEKTLHHERCHIVTGPWHG